MRIIGERIRTRLGDLLLLRSNMEKEYKKIKEVSKELSERCFSGKSYDLTVIVEEKGDTKKIISIFLFKEELAKLIEDHYIKQIHG